MKAEHLQVYRIGGQLWREVRTTTLEQDFFLMKQLKAAGLKDCTLRQGETPEELGVRLLYAVVEHGAPFELLGAMLIPEGMADEKWTPERADETGAVLKKLTADADKKEAQRCLVDLLASFFREGLRYYAASRTALKASAQPETNVQSGAAQNALNS